MPNDLNVIVKQLQDMTKAVVDMKHGLGNVATETVKMVDIFAGMGNSPSVFSQQLSIELEKMDERIRNKANKHAAMASQIQLLNQQAAATGGSADLLGDARRMEHLNKVIADYSREVLQDEQDREDLYADLVSKKLEESAALKDLVRDAKRHNLLADEHIAILENGYAKTAKAMEAQRKGGIQVSNVYDMVSNSVDRAVVAITSAIPAYAVLSSMGERYSQANLAWETRNSLLETGLKTSIETGIAFERVADVQRAILDRGQKANAQDLNRVELAAMLSSSLDIQAGQVAQINAIASATGSSFETLAGTIASIVSETSATGSEAAGWAVNIGRVAQHMTLARNQMPELLYGVARMEDRLKRLTGQSGLFADTLIKASTNLRTSILLGTGTRGAIGMGPEGIKQVAQGVEMWAGMLRGVEQGPLREMMASSISGITGVSNELLMLQANNRSYMDEQKKLAKEEEAWANNLKGTEAVLESYRRNTYSAGRGLTTLGTQIKAIAAYLTAPIFEKFNQGLELMAVLVKQGIDAWKAWDSEMKPVIRIIAGLTAALVGLFLAFKGISGIFGKVGSLGRGIGGFFGGINSGMLKFGVTVLIFTASAWIFSKAIQNIASAVKEIGDVKGLDSAVSAITQLTFVLGVATAAIVAIGAAIAAFAVGTGGVGLAALAAGIGLVAGAVLSVAASISLVVGSISLAVYAVGKYYEKKAAYIDAEVRHAKAMAELSTAMAGPSAKLGVTNIKSMAEAFDDLGNSLRSFNENKHWWSFLKGGDSALSAFEEFGKIVNGMQGISMFASAITTVAEGFERMRTAVEGLSTEVSSIFGDGNLALIEAFASKIDSISKISTNVKTNVSDQMAEKVVQPVANAIAGVADALDKVGDMIEGQTQYMQAADQRSASTAQASRRDLKVNRLLQGSTHRPYFPTPSIYFEHAIQR